MIRAVLFLLLFTAPAWAKEPPRPGDALVGHYTLRGAYDTGVRSEAVLRIERREGRLHVTRVELARGGQPLAPTRVWRARAVRVLDAERFFVTFEAPADQQRRGLVGALGGGGVAPVVSPNVLRARYLVRAGRLTEGVENATRRAPEHRWRHLQSVGRHGPPHELRSVRTLVGHGAPADRYDLVFVPEAFTAEALGAFDLYVQRVVDELSVTSPFKELWSLFNVHVVRFADASSERGAPTAAGTRLSKDPWGFPQPDWKRARALGEYAPGADAVVVITDHSFRSLAEDGVTVASAWHGRFERMVVHELGHVVGRLLDEYEEYPDSRWDFVYGNAINELLIGQTGWGGNVTTHTERRFVPWGHWLAEGARLPTPADHPTEVGLYRGALHRSRYWYRPALTCRMRGDDAPFCVVCRELLTIRLAAQTWPVRAKAERIDGETLRFTLETDLATPSQVLWLRNGMVEVGRGPTYVARRDDQPWGESNLDAIVQIALPWVRVDPEGQTTFRTRFVLNKGQLWSKRLEVRGPSRRRGFPEDLGAPRSPF